MDRERSRRIGEAFSRFLETGLDDALAEEAEAAVALFRRTAESVPAYRDFLGKYGFAPDSVRTKSDFPRVPIMTKQNYVLAYPLAARCPGGVVDGCDMVAVSSGSTGTPTFWPRGAVDEYEIGRAHV